MKTRRSSVKNKDIISDMPQNIIDTILTKLPIRDAVRTSILSTKWRFQWSTMTQLVFDENCVPPPFTPEKLNNFMMPCLFLHQGPIHKFKLTTTFLVESPGIDQCLRFLSRKNMKELDLCVDMEALNLDESPLLSAPSPMFSCQQITSLTLGWYIVVPPSNFRGFPCLKYLNLYCCTVTLKVIENLISGCPLLETFEFTNHDELALTLKAPNLKHLNLEGTFKDVNLKHTPLLTDLSIELFSEVMC